MCKSYFLIASFVWGGVVPGAATFNCVDSNTLIRCGGISKVHFLNVWSKSFQWFKRLFSNRHTGETCMLYSHVADSDNRRYIKLYKSHL